MTITNEELEEIKQKIEVFDLIRVETAQKLLTEIKRLKEENQSLEKSLKFVEKESRQEIRNLNEELRQAISQGQCK